MPSTIRPLGYHVEINRHEFAIQHPIIIVGEKQIINMSVPNMPVQWLKT
jgi:hypothetical protein